MERFVYSATFKGAAEPANEAGTELKARTTTSALAALDGSRVPAGVGPALQFESTVVIGEDGLFAESGTIDFGAGNSIRFSELVRGAMAPAADGLTAGTIGWKVESGTGVFAGASGYIGSNFTVGGAGEVTDHHVGAILLGS